ncbi:Threonylcarbamoyl-AMP synthase [Diplonema papillatum]|nr:Threonylcarbamoyl-AMP synthase [Diplonema papillatum]
MSLLTCSPEDLRRASDALREGKLVSFPTETVYGLGAHALDATAAKKVFEVKGRPASDPLIVHVLSWADVEPLVQVRDPQQRAAAVALAAQLWPGPLTLVLPAADNVPSVVTGGSGWVGVRSPKHEVARRLLEVSSLPLAAPSANRFNHVSPTRPEHVLKDLAARDPSLLVIDGGPCSVGIESSVVKVHADHLEILRHGAVSPADMLQALDSMSPPPATPFRVVERDTRSKPKQVSDQMEGPGQMLTHYAPDVPAYLLDPLPAKVEGEAVRCGELTFALKQAVVVDYNGAFAALEEGCAAYCDLSASGIAEEAAAQVFAVLRWTEDFQTTASVVLLPVLPCSSDNIAQAVNDRLFRAASGRKAALGT